MNAAHMAAEDDDGEGGQDFDALLCDAIAGEALLDCEVEPLKQTLAALSGSTDHFAKMLVDEPFVDAVIGVNEMCKAVAAASESATTANASRAVDAAQEATTAAADAVQGVRLTPAATRLAAAAIRQQLEDDAERRDALDRFRLFCKHPYVAPVPVSECDCARLFVSQRLWYSSHPLGESAQRLTLALFAQLESLEVDCSCNGSVLDLAALLLTVPRSCSSVVVSFCGNPAHGVFPDPAAFRKPSAANSLLGHFQPRRASSPAALSLSSSFQLVLKVFDSPAPSLVVDCLHAKSVRPLQPKPP